MGDEKDPESDDRATQKAALQPIAFTTIKQNSQREEGYVTFGLTAAVHMSITPQRISDMEEAAASADRLDDDRILGGWFSWKIPCSS
jgi:hypothetical protein